MIVSLKVKESLQLKSFGERECYLERGHKTRQKLCSFNRFLKGGKFKRTRYLKKPVKILEKGKWVS